MKTTIVGVGNIGMQFAVHYCEKNHEVTVYTSRSSFFDTHLYIVNQLQNAGF